MDNVISLKGLTKVYGEKCVVDHFTLDVEKGHIYGLIGPNGAGKTTIMKMIAGLTNPTEGQIELFGSENGLNENRERTSFMIEAPYLDKSFTARENMEYICRLRGVADVSKIDEILELVGLAHTGTKIVKHFSLGMKQRLGIAMALLPDPEIMVLDEPVNGLDPEGIVEVRNLLKQLREERGITILISSHLLAELSELCTDFAIIDKGVLVECLSKEQLEEQCRSYIEVATDDEERLATVLEQQLGITNYRVMENKDIRIYEMLEELAVVSKTITDAGLMILKFHIQGENLEEYFLSKVSSSGEESGDKSVFGKLLRKAGREI